MGLIDRVTVDVLLERGFASGTSLENQVAAFVSRYWRPPDVRQQFRVGKYRLDFAWPDIQVDLEADGWYHREPATALRDNNRDAYLREQGWLVFRVSNHAGVDNLLDQVARVVRIVSLERASCSPPVKPSGIPLNKLGATSQALAAHRRLSLGDQL